MSETIQLELPEDVARQARAVAEWTHRRLEDVLIEWLGQIASEPPVHLLPDDQVLALRDAQMNEADQSELSALLEQQREGVLDSAGRERLAVLMERYRHGLVRKAQALRVAVERGLDQQLA